MFFDIQRVYLDPFGGVDFTPEKAGKCSISTAGTVKLYISETEIINTEIFNRVERCKKRFDATLGKVALHPNSLGNEF